MGFLNDAVSLGTLGLVDDFTGEEGAQAAATAANQSASQAQTQMFGESLDFQKEMFDWQKQQTGETLQAIRPWEQAGMRGLSGYESLLQDPSSITQTPGYSFRLSEGLKALENSAAARGGLLSGATGKGLMRYGQDYATSEFDKGLSRYGTLANFGVGALNQRTGTQATLQNLASQHAGNVSNLYSSQGTNLANMYMNQGQIDAAAARAPFNNLMAMGQLGLAAYGMGGFGRNPAGGAGGGAGNVGLPPMQFGGIPNLSLSGYSSSGGFLD